MSGTSGGLEVEFAGELYELAPGRDFTMGRVGDLIFDDNPYLHRHFLSLAYSDGFWWIANVGSRAAAVLADPGGLSRSTLGPGARLPLVFGHTVVTFSAGPTTYEVNLTLDAPAWELSREHDMDTDGETTIGPTTFTDSQMLAILALAEPLLRRTGTASWHVPSAVDAARRLGWTQTRFNRKLDNVCDKLDRVGVRGLKGGPGRQALGRRVVLAEYAVNARIVTPSHLSALDTEHRRNHEGNER